MKVRHLGQILNVPEQFLKRHPFPGPGLAVRVLGDVTEGNALDVLRQVCVVYASSENPMSLFTLLNLSFLPLLFRLMKFSFNRSRRQVFMI